MAKVNGSYLAGMVVGHGALRVECAAAMGAASRETYPETDPKLTSATRGLYFLGDPARSPLPVALPIYSVF